MAPEQNAVVSDDNVMPGANVVASETIFSKMNQLVELGNQLHEMQDSARIVRSLGDIKPSLDAAIAAIQMLQTAISIEEQVERYGNLPTRQYNAAVGRGEVPLIVQRRISGQPAPVAATPEAAPEQATPEREQPREQGGIWERLGGQTEGRARLGGVHQTVNAPVANRETQPAPQREAGNVQTVEDNQPRSFLDQGIEITRFGIRRQ